MRAKRAKHVTRLRQIGGGDATTTSAGGGSRRRQERGKLRTHCGRRAAIEAIVRVARAADANPLSAYDCHLGRFGQGDGAGRAEREACSTAHRGAAVPIAEQRELQRRAARKVVLEGALVERRREAEQQQQVRRFRADGSGRGANASGGGGGGGG